MEVSAVLLVFSFSIFLGFSGGRHKPLIQSKTLNFKNIFLLQFFDLTNYTALILATLILELWQVETRAWFCYWMLIRICFLLDQMMHSSMDFWD